ncbi:hypothetical protein B0H15DRAFT_795003 [Mycena belliarum]|uniref:Uncharacterized protein n=1 Tax=Mycena belliarum TaxID=1033014 RepID=A0AAD6XWL8_9AGAR|nr:hypothetical protein B0H15DRAFT_795003 [Mycena belliae]
MFAKPLLPLLLLCLWSLPHTADVFLAFGSFYGTNDFSGSYLQQMISETVDYSRRKASNKIQSNQISLRPVPNLPDPRPLHARPAPPLGRSPCGPLLPTSGCMEDWSRYRAQNVVIKDNWIDPAVYYSARKAYYIKSGVEYRRRVPPARHPAGSGAIPSRLSGCK